STPATPAPPAPARAPLALVVGVVCAVVDSVDSVGSVGSVVSSVVCSGAGAPVGVLTDTAAGAAAGVLTRTSRVEGHLRLLEGQGGRPDGGSRVLAAGVLLRGLGRLDGARLTRPDMERVVSGRFRHRLPS
ncbi:MAG: hypothetical protein ACRDPK_01635, partial [Carbonactinosporaceae bacterium]